jgi:outer membrane immunogenic protein
MRSHTLAYRSHSFSVSGLPHNISSASRGARACAGIEWAASNWPAKVEYNYLRLDDRTFTVPAGSPFLAGDTFNRSNRNVQMVKVGMNYLFNWSGYRY